MGCPHPEGPSLRIGPPLLRLGGSRNLEVGEAGPWGRAGGSAWEEGRGGGGGGGGRKPSLPLGPSQGSYQGSLHPGLPLPLSVSPSARPGEETQGLLGASSCLELPRGLPPSTQGRCSGAWAFLLHERKEKSPGGGGAPGPRAMDTSPRGACLTFSVEGFLLCAFKVGGDRPDPRTNHPVPPRLRHSPCVLARSQHLTAYPPPLDSGAEGLGAVKEMAVSS